MCMREVKVNQVQEGRSKREGKRERGLGEREQGR
jgi:hypothetical protein